MPIKTKLPDAVAARVLCELEHFRRTRRDPTKILTRAEIEAALRPSPAAASIDLCLREGWAVIPKRAKAHQVAVTADGRDMTTGPVLQEIVRRTRVELEQIEEFVKTARGRRRSLEHTDHPRLTQLIEDLEAFAAGKPMPKREAPAGGVDVPIEAPVPYPDAKEQEAERRRRRGGEDIDQGGPDDTGEDEDREFDDELGPEDEEGQDEPEEQPARVKGKAAKSTPKSTSKKKRPVRS